MQKRYIKYAGVVLVVALSACSGLPTSPPEAEQSALSEDVTAPEVVTPKLKAGTESAFRDAVSLLEAGDLQGAQQIFMDLTRRQPELAGPWVNLGLIHLAQEDQDQAREAFERALSANSRNCDALNQLGVLARREGRFQDAESYYLQCLEAEHEYPPARLNLAILYELYMGRLGEALAAYNDYQLMLDEPDVRVNGWVMDLERRVAAVAKR